MASKKDNAMMLDPNRFKIAQQNAVMPGGPMNNNPMNVTSVGPQPGLCWLTSIPTVTLVSSSPDGC